MILFLALALGATAVPLASPGWGWVTLERLPVTEQSEIVKDHVPAAFLESRQKGSILKRRWSDEIVGGTLYDLETGIMSVQWKVEQGIVIRLTAWDAGVMSSAR